MIRMTLIVTFLLSSSSAINADDRQELTLWPEGLPADARPLSAEEVKKLEAAQTVERISYVASPTLTMYPAPGDVANGCSVIICPGGGYNILAWPKEGLEVAEWFNSIGVTAGVLKYRVPRRDPDRIHWEPLQDVQRAIRVMRKHATQWQVDPGRVGVLGFSAGGHLTLMAGTHFSERTYDPVDDADDLSARPDFICPIYAAYLGNNYRDDAAQLGSLVIVDKTTPPAFMAVTLDDTYRGVQAGLLLAEFKRAGVSAEAHIYAEGGHGYGIRPSTRPVSSWHLRLQDWMAARGLLERQNR